MCVRVEGCFLISRLENDAARETIERRVGHIPSYVSLHHNVTPVQLVHNWGMDSTLLLSIIDRLERMTLSEYLALNYTELVALGYNRIDAAKYVARAQREKWYLTSEQQVALDMLILVRHTSHTLHTHTLHSHSRAHKYLTYRRSDLAPQERLAPLYRLLRAHGKKVMVWHDGWSTRRPAHIDGPDLVTMWAPCASLVAFCACAQSVPQHTHTHAAATQTTCAADCSQGGRTEGCFVTICRSPLDTTVMYTHTPGTRS